MIQTEQFDMGLAWMIIVVLALLVICAAAYGGGVLLEAHEEVTKE